MFPKPKNLNYPHTKAIRLILVTRNYRKKKEKNNFYNFLTFTIN